MSIYATPTSIEQTIKTNRLYEKVNQSLARWKKKDKKYKLLILGIKQDMSLEILQTFKG